jgi:hypothetical protein
LSNSAPTAPSTPNPRHKAAGRQAGGSQWINPVHPSALQIATLSGLKCATLLKLLAAAAWAVIVATNPTWKHGRRGLCKGSQISEFDQRDRILRFDKGMIPFLNWNCIEIHKPKHYELPNIMVPHSESGKFRERGAIKDDYGAGAAKVPGIVSNHRQ